MAKVGNFRVQINGEMKEFDLHYTQKLNFHLKGFPEEVSRVSEFFPRDYSTEQQLHTAMLSAVHKYHELMKTQRKIIAYRINLPADFRSNRERRGCWSGFNSMVPKKLQHKIGDVGHYHGAGTDWIFGFIASYEVCYEVNEQSGKKYYPCNADGTMGSGSSNPDRSKVMIMDWSVEREAFFIAMMEQARKMVEKLLVFFAQDEEELLKSIEAGAQKLLN